MRKSLFSFLGAGVLALSSLVATSFAYVHTKVAPASSPSAQTSSASSSTATTATYALLALARAKSFTVTYTDSNSETGESPTYSDVYSIEGGYLQRSWESQTYALLQGLVTQHGNKYVYGVKKTDQGYVPSTVLLQADPNQTGVNVPMQTIESVQKVDDLLTISDLAGKIKSDAEGAYTDDTDVIFDLVSAAHLGSYVGGNYIQRVRLTPQSDGSLTIKLQKKSGLGSYGDYLSDPNENTITYSKLNSSSIAELADFVKTYKMNDKTLADEAPSVVKNLTGENIRITSKMYFVKDGESITAESAPDNTTTFELSHDNIKLSVDNAASKANGSQFYHRGNLDKAEQKVLLGNNTVQSNVSGEDFDTFVVRPWDVATSQLPYFVQDTTDTTLYHYYGIIPDTFFQNFTQLSENIGYVDSLSLRVVNGVASQMVTQGPQSVNDLGEAGHLEVHTTIENTDANPLKDLVTYVSDATDIGDFQKAMDYLKNPTENFSIVSTYAAQGGDWGIAPAAEGGEVDPGMGEGGQSGGGNTLIYDKANDILLRENGSQTEGWVGKDGKVVNFRVFVDNNAQTEEESFLPKAVSAPVTGESTLDNLSFFNDSKFDLNANLVQKDASQSDATSSYYVLKNNGEDLTDVAYHILGSSNLNYIYNKSLWFGIQDGRFLQSGFDSGGPLGAATDNVAFSYGAEAKALTSLQIQKIKNMADWVQPKSWKDESINMYEELVSVFGEAAFVDAIPYLYDPAYSGFWLSENTGTNSFTFFATNMNPSNLNQAALYQAKYTALLLSLGFKKTIVPYATGGTGTFYVKGNMQIRPSDAENNGILVRKTVE